ncbi:hypothetical protein [Paraburkholderia caribensis]|uniref:hypothetical protein n=1 Tax=Paraburkholderia caribensis TaxID=75105 RepID=UPI001D05FDFA|nr:hypothetical protein [Paraburkholderia caribensis]
MIAHAGSSPVAAATFHDAGHADVPGAGIASSIRFDSLRFVRPDDGFGESRFNEKARSSGRFSLELPPRILKEPQTIVVNRKVKVVSTSGTKALSLRA